MKLFPAERSEDLTAFAQRAMDSFLGRSVMRFIRMEGFDRSIVLSSQAFTALIPLFIIVASAAPAGEESAIADAFINRFALTGDSAAAVEQLFTTPPGATSSVTIFSALLLLYSGVAFTRRMQRMYRAAWEQEKVGVRSTVFATLGLLALVAEVAVAYAIRRLFADLPLDWLWAIPLSAATGLLLWTSIPYLLLDRRVHWRRVLVTGGASAAATTAVAIATPIYMPAIMTRATNEFGLFGITITLIGYLLAASFVLVACAAVGAEFDASNVPWVMALKVRFKLMDPGREVPLTEPAGRRGLTSGDLLALIRVLKNWLIMSAAVWIATAVRAGDRRARRSRDLPRALVDLRPGQRRARPGAELVGWFPELAHHGRLGTPDQRDPVRDDSRSQPQPGHRGPDQRCARSPRGGGGRHVAGARLPSCHTH